MRKDHVIKMIQKHFHCISKYWTNLYVDVIYRGLALALFEYMLHNTAIHKINIDKDLIKNAVIQRSNNISTVMENSSLQKAMVKTVDSFYLTCITYTLLLIYLT